MVVKCTLFATCVVSLLLGASFNTIFSMCVISLLVPRSTQNCSYTTLYLSTIGSTQDCTSQMHTMCYCGLKSNRRICKYALIMPLLAYSFVKKCAQEKVWWLYIFFHNHNYLGGTGKFIYKALILDMRQFLSSITDCEATQIPQLVCVSAFSLTIATNILFLSESVFSCFSDHLAW